MKNFVFTYALKSGTTNTYTITWKDGKTVICSGDVTLNGTEEEISKAIAANAMALRKQNALLFVDDFETVLPGQEEA